MINLPQDIRILIAHHVAEDFPETVQKFCETSKNCNTAMLQGIQSTPLYSELQKLLTEMLPECFQSFVAVTRQSAISIFYKNLENIFDPRPSPKMFPQPEISRFKFLKFRLDNGKVTRARARRAVAQVTDPEMLNLNLPGMAIATFADRFVAQVRCTDHNYISAIQMFLRDL